MATQEVTWTTSICLECKRVLPSDVVLCVPTVVTENESGFLDAQLVSASSSCNVNCGTFNTYTFEYDDADLANPDELLTSSEINNAFCKNCFTDWIEWLISEA